MAIQLDNFNTQQKQVYVIAGVAIGLVFSNVSFALRVWAKLITIKKLQREDWFMLAGLLLSYAIAVCMFYGLTTGLAQHVTDVSKPELKNFLLSLWVIQRFQPPTLFCIKTSIILFYVRLFPTQQFKIVAWCVWTYSALWTCGAWLGSLLECRPVNFFWDKTINGTCVNNPLITVGLTSGVLSCVGDILIFSMPIPVLAKLHLNTKKKIALSGIFMIGLFVVCTSFVRWVALLGTATDVTFSQVEAGVWTYLEVSIGITTGNLPLLAPLFRRCLSSRNNTSKGYDNSGSGARQTRPTAKMASAQKSGIYDGFTRMEDSPSGSEVELRDRDLERGQKNNIIVSTQVDVRHEDEDWQKSDIVLGHQLSSARAYRTDGTPV